MMAAQRVPNTVLRAMLAEAGLSGQDLARSVNRAAAESGLVLRYDRTTVAHWLAGSRPPEHVAALAAECLSRALGRRVTASQAALSRRTGRPRALEPVEDATDTLIRLAGTVFGKREAARVLPFSLDLPTFNPSALDSAQRRSPAAPVHSVPDTATLLVPVFAEADALHGGGYAHTALTAYLVSGIAPALRTTSGPRERQRLLVQAARLSYLVGYMRFDTHLGGAAQAYYRASASLSAQAGDLAGYSTALRAMSIQAHYLQHHAFAHQLAEAAARHIPALPSGHAPELTAQLALTTAANGDRFRAHAHMHHAEQLLGKVESPGGTIGTFHHSALAHQQAEVLAATGDSTGAIAAMESSLSHRPDGERRARALTRARLAELHLDQGHLEQACAAWQDFLQDQPHLRSARATEALATMRARLRPHHRVQAANALLQQSSRRATRATT